MACTVEHRRLYCTTADVSFGPEFETDEEGERFRSWVYKNFGDPREFSTKQLTVWYVGDWDADKWPQEV